MVYPMAFLLDDLSDHPHPTSAWGDTAITMYAHVLSIPNNPNPNRIRSDYASQSLA